MKNDMWQDQAEKEKREFYKRQRMLRFIFFVCGFVLGAFVTLYILRII